MTKIHLAIVLLSSLALMPVSQVARASDGMQVRDAVEGKTIFVKMSTRDFNRVAIEGGRVRLVKGADRDMVLGDKDDVTGQALIKPLVKDPFSLFVFSESGMTYTIVVQPMDIPSESIILVEQLPKKPAARVAMGKSEKSAGYIRAIKSLIHVMNSEKVPPEIEVRSTWEEIALWQGTRFALEKVYSDQLFVGEAYRLFNLGQSTIRIAEQEFYKQGVIAVAVKALELEPGKSTQVFVVKRNEGVR